MLRNFEATQTLPVPVCARFMRRCQRLELELAQLLEEIDVLLTPTTAVAAFDAESPCNVMIEGEKVDPAMTCPSPCWQSCVGTLLS